MIVDETLINELLDTGRVKSGNFGHHVKSDSDIV